MLFETGRLEVMSGGRWGFGLGKGAGEENGNEEKEKGTNY